MLGERIYCSDTWGNMPIDMSGQNISIVFDLNNEDEVNAVKELEAKAKELGCTITLPLGKTEWTELFGMFDDPFGVSWLLNGEKLIKQFSLRLEDIIPWSKIFYLENN